MQESTPSKQNKFIALSKLNFFVPESVATILKRYCCNKKIAIAFSGGGDSVFLLLSLIKLSSELNSKFCALYFNHNLRAQNIALQEESFCKEFCHFYGVEFFCERAKENEIEKIAKSEKKSIEECARDLRYNFFDEVRNREQIDLILTAHHESDNIETLLMRYFAASSAEGLIGIEEKSDCFCRPLINLTKEQILSILDENKISYLVDHTNFENKYLRNKIRNLALPTIYEIYPDLNSRLKALSQKMKLQKQANDFYIEPLLSEVASRRAKKVLRFEELNIFYGLFIEIEKLFSLPLFFRVILVQKLVDLLCIEKNKNVVVPFKMVQGALNKNISEIKFGQFLFSFAEIALRVDYFLGKLVCGVVSLDDGKRQSECFCKKSICFDYEVGTQKSVEVANNLSLKIYTDFTIPLNSVALAVELFSKEQVEKNKIELEFRKLENSDVIATSSGKKEIKKIFSDWKISSLHRDLPLGVFLENNLVAILGSLVNQKDIICSKYLSSKSCDNKRMVIISKNCC